MDVAVVASSLPLFEAACLALRSAGLSSRYVADPATLESRCAVVAIAQGPTETASLCRSIRSSNHAARIIAVSSDADAARALDAGADDVIALDAAPALWANRLLPRFPRPVPPAQDEALDSDRRFEDLVQSIEATVWEADATTAQMTYVSPRAEALLGYPAERWLEHDFWPNHIIEEDRQEAVAYCLSRTAALEDHAFEYRMLHADGRVIWIRDLVTVVAVNGAARTLRGVMYDITEQKQTVADLRASEERFRAFAESTTTAMWSYTAERWIYCNDAMVELTGYPRELLMEPGFYLNEVIAPEFRALADERAMRRLAGEYIEPWLEYRIIDSRGKEHWLRTTGSSFSSNGIVTAVANAFDITERRRNEDGLRRSEERLELAFKAGDLSPWDVDLTTNTLAHDIRLAQLLGIPTTGKADYAEMAQRIHPDDRVAANQGLMSHLRGETPSIDNEFRIADGEGGWRWLRSRGRVVLRREDGRALRAAGTYQDITDQRRAEELRAESEADMRAMFESSSYGIILMSPSFAILRSNREARLAVQVYWGHDLDDNVPLLDQVPPDTANFLRESAEEVIRTGSSTSCERDLQTNDGPVPHEFQFTPIYLADGTIRGVGMAARNIRQRRQDEMALRQSQKLESLGQLVGGVAHDFNNLLAAILGYATLASASLPAESPTRADIDEVIHAAQSAADLTRQLLTFARRQHVEPRDVDVNELLPGVERLLIRLIGENIRLGVARSQGPLVVRIDPGQFEQVVLNLAINARDAMPSGGRLTIQARHVADISGKVPGWACIAVSDTGSGMSMETLERIFEPFFTTKEQGKGTGLGLATCHGIVTHGGGKIEVLTEEGRGTTMVVWLPLIEGESHLAPEAPGETVAATRDALILVVEDQPDVRSLTSRALGRGGYRVLQASGPVQAMELAAANPDIDLIVSDIVMPMMDGVALLELLGPVLGHKPVIFVSGYADQEVVDRALSRPGAKFLSKPFSLDALCALVSEALD